MLFRSVYALNVIDNPPDAFVRAEAATLRAVFDDLVVLGSPSQRSGESGGNYVLVASDAPLSRQALAAAAAARGQRDQVGEGAPFAADAQVLTDDDAPVDQLLTPYPRSS